jgi:hypothetical protein
MDDEYFQPAQRVPATELTDNIVGVRKLEEVGSGQGGQRGRRAAG